MTLKQLHDRHVIGQRDHSGTRGHYCPEWDFLYICEDCPEFEACHCMFGDPDAINWPEGTPLQLWTEERVARVSRRNWPINIVLAILVGVLVPAAVAWPVIIVLLVMAGYMIWHSMRQ